MSPLILPLLLAVALVDMRHLRIPDILTIAAVAGFVALSPALSPDEIIARLVAGFASFAICFFLFSVRAMGGGDAKFIPALVLWIPPFDLVFFCMALALCIPISIALILAMRQAVPAPSWKGLSATPRVPMGVAIAMAGAATFVATA